MSILKQFYVLIILIMINVTIGAQSYTEGDLSIWITGGSTLHDWKVVAEEVSDFPTSLELDAEDLLDIDDFSFTVDVKSMDGGRGPAMNNKIYKALLADTHPEIIFNQEKAVQFKMSESDAGNKGVIDGSVIIAGKKRNIAIQAKGENSNGQLKFTGEMPLKLSDFDIEPPSAMFGQIQTKDDIVVHFELVYQKS